MTTPIGSPGTAGAGPVSPADAAAGASSPVWLGSGVELRSSRSELAAADDPDQRRWDELLLDYQAREAVIGCIEAAAGRTPSDAELERFTDLLAQRIATDHIREAGGSETLRCAAAHVRHGNRSQAGHLPPERTRVRQSANAMRDDAHARSVAEAHGTDDEERRAELLLC